VKHSTVYVFSDKKRRDMHPVHYLLAAALVLSFVQVSWAQGNFTLAASGSVPDGPDHVVLADLNGDGKPDVLVSTWEPAIAGPGVYVKLQLGSGSFDEPRRISPKIPSKMVTGDFDGDGIVDVAFATYSGVDVTIIYGDSSGQFARIEEIWVGDGATDLAVADLNGDLTLDLIVRVAGGLAILLGDGSGHFATPALIGTASEPYCFVLHDVNNDGFPDIVIKTADGLYVFLANHQGSVGEPIQALPSGRSNSAILVADFDGDGIPDLSTDGVVLIGNGDGHFGLGVELGGQFPAPSWVGDFNGDGVPDLFSGDYRGLVEGLLLWLGDGDGSFGEVQQFQLPRPLTPAMAVADFVGDGTSQALVATDLSSSCNIFCGAGMLLVYGSGPGLQTQELGFTTEYSTELVTGDLNDDGRPDFVAVSFPNDSAAIGLNVSVPQPRLLIRVQGLGSVTMDPPGIACERSCSTPLLQDQQVTLTATSIQGSLFLGWSGACTGAGNCSLTMDAAKSVTAIFDSVPTPEFHLAVARSGRGSGSVTSSPGGIDCGVACYAGFDAGTVVTLTASPSAGADFAGWSGDCAGSGACVLTMSAARIVTARFDLAAYALNVGKNGNGSGTVTSNPAGLDCGNACLANFDYGTQVTLTATPAVGSVFAGWSGACTGTSICTVTMNATQTVTAAFNTLPPSQYALTVTRDGTGSGTVTSSPAGINCGPTCSANFPSGTVVTLTAVAASGSTFAGWSGACTGSGTCSVAMDMARNVTASLTCYPRINLRSPSRPAAPAQET